MMKRKDFIKKIAVGGSVLLAAPALFEACGKNDLTGVDLSNPATIDLTSNSYSSLQTVGGYAYRGQIIVIRVSNTQYVALSSICTHQGCQVEYSSSLKEIICYCHGSIFSTSGSVLRGPAFSNLKQYNVTIDGNTLTIT